MLIYANQDTGDLYTDANNFRPDVILSGTYGSRQQVKLQFLRNGAPENLLDMSGTILGVKKSGVFDGPFLASVSAWTGPDANNYYTGLLDLNVAAIATALNVDADTTNDLSFLPCHLEIDWKPNGSTDVQKSTPRDFTVNNSLIRGNEAPLTTGNPAYALPQAYPTLYQAVTGLTGGGSNLDAIVTAGGVAALVVACPYLTPVLWWLRQLNIVSSTLAADSVITTDKPHKFVNGQTVTLAGCADATLNGDHVLTVTSPTSFSVPTTTTGAGAAGGYVVPANDGASIVRPADYNAVTNPVFWQSLL